MKFTVVWTKEAEKRLAELWLDSADREAVTNASDRIDHLLSIDPLHAGEERVVNFRILFEPPLAVTFDINEQDLRVKVWSIWRPTQ